jgi:hypothetical protein
LVTGVLGGVLSFFPVDERLKAGRVSKQWRAAMMQPSLWRDQGWHLARYIDKANALPLPLWLRERLSVVRCSVDWLLYAHPFAQFCQLKNVRRLDLLAASKVDMTVTEDGALRRHLSSLALQSLQLPWDRDVFDDHSRLLSVLTQPEPNDQAPSPMTSWSVSLTHLRCEMYLWPDDPLLMALTAQVWPLLRKLQLPGIVTNRNISCRSCSNFVAPSSLPQHLLSHGWKCVWAASERTRTITVSATGGVCISFLPCTR